jgi:hypothetical protein
VIDRFGTCCQVKYEPKGLCEFNIEARDPGPLPRGRQRGHFVLLARTFSVLSHKSAAAIRPLAEGRRR